LNLLSLTSHYGKQVQKTSYKLLDEGLYDFVGTDTHHTGHTGLLRTIATKKNKKYLDRLILNNSKILD
jgi:tyrosine-protein phosphatase YwqE